MITAITRFHYICNEYKEFDKAITHHFSKGSEAFVDEMRLIDDMGTHTDFEKVPADIEAWMNTISLDFTYFHGLSKIWGPERCEYAFTLYYELSHECDSVTGREHPVVFPYYVQLPLLLDAAEKISEALPDTFVRLHERAAPQDQHELEIAFPYPCDPDKIHAACEILNSQFSYVWDIGCEPIESAAVISLANKTEDAEKEFELVLPNGIILTAKTDSDKQYPGIMVSMRTQSDDVGELLCFVELNSDKPEGKQIYIGAYAHNTEDPAYYACYYDDGVSYED
jgi:hypothetical protein